MAGQCARAAQQRRTPDDPLRGRSQRRHQCRHAAARGGVGRAIAERLADERNSVTVVDLSSEALARLADELGVATVEGHGSHPDVLDRAGAADCDILFAVTPSDEVNITACTVSHTLFNVPTKI